MLLDLINIPAALINLLVFSNKTNFINFVFLSKENKIYKICFNLYRDILS